MTPNVPNAKVRLLTKTPVLWMIAIALPLVLSLGACDSSNGPGTDGGGYDSLHVPRSVLLDSGAVAFSTCQGCHNGRGVGTAGVVPPLLHSDFFIAQRMRPARILLMGLPNAIDSVHPITVNGLEYSDEMPNIAILEEWSNLRIAAVLTYIRSTLNDSTATNCDPDNRDDFGFATCTLVPRPAAANDSIAVWEVKALRDSLIGVNLCCHQGT